MASDNEASCESDPNFAVICAFMEKFGVTCGLASIDFLELQEMLENTQEVPQELIDLHIKLLRKSRKTVSNERWEKAIIKFCHGFCVQDAWEIERFGYKKARLSSKLRVLKELLEMQFDYNAKFKAEINKMSAEELRSQPLGKDKQGHAYWFQNDNSCQIRVYKEDPDEETWTLVAKDRDGLVSLINELSNGDSKISSESLINEEDSNSLAEKPIIDTGQVDTFSSDSNKKSLVESENSNESKKGNVDVSDTVKKEDISSQAGIDENAQMNDTNEVSEDEIEKNNEEEGAEEEEEEIEEEEEEEEEEGDELEDGEDEEEVKKSSLQLKTKNETFKRTRENDNDDENMSKKVNIEKYEVSEAIEEPIMLVKGEGTGVENQCINNRFEENPIVGDEIEEDLMYFYGSGSGVDCQTGNEDKSSADSKKSEDSSERVESVLSEQSTAKDSGGSCSENYVSISISSDLKNRVNEVNIVSSSDDIDGSSKEVPTSPVKSPYKLGTIIDTKTDNKFFNAVKSSTKKSRWDVETIIAKDTPQPNYVAPNVTESVSTGRVKQLVNKWEQINSDEDKVKTEESESDLITPKKSMFFFGPGCLQFSPVSCSATVGFGQKVPQINLEEKFDLSKNEDQQMIPSNTKGDIGYRISNENVEQELDKDNKKVGAAESIECVQSSNGTITHLDREVQTKKVENTSVDFLVESKIESISENAKSVHVSNIKDSITEVEVTDNVKKAETKVSQHNVDVIITQEAKKHHSVIDKTTKEDLSAKENSKEKEECSNSITLNSSIIESDNEKNNSVIKKEDASSVKNMVNKDNVIIGHDKNRNVSSVVKKNEDLLQEYKGVEEGVKEIVSETNISKDKEMITFSELEKEVVADKIRENRIADGSKIPEVTATLLECDEKMTQSTNLHEEQNSSDGAFSNKTDEMATPVIEKMCTKEDAYILGDEATQTMEKQNFEEIDEDKINEIETDTKLEMTEIKSDNFKSSEMVNNSGNKDATNYQKQDIISVAERRFTETDSKDFQLCFEHKSNCFTKDETFKENEFVSEIHEKIKENELVKSENLINLSIEKEVETSNSESKEINRKLEGVNVEEKVCDNDELKNTTNNANNKNLKSKRNNFVEPSVDDEKKCKMLTRRTRSSKNDDAYETSFKEIDETPILTDPVDVSFVKEEIKSNLKVEESDVSKTEESRSVVPPRRGRSRGIPKDEKQNVNEEDTNKKMKLTDEVENTTVETVTVRQIRNKLKEDNINENKNEAKLEEGDKISDCEKDLNVEFEQQQDKALSTIVSSKVEDSIVVESSSSNDVVELTDKDPLAVSGDEIKQSEEKPIMSLSNFSLDFNDSPVPTPPLTRSGLRKRGRESPQNTEDAEGTPGKRIKMKGKRTVDVNLRKSIEEQKKQELISSDDDNAKSQQPEQNEENNQERKNGKKKGSKSNKKNESNKNDESVIVSSDAEAETSQKDTQSVQKKSKSINKNKRLLSNLGIDPDQPIEFNEEITVGVRQSRRIAQLKIKEEAERRKLEEELAQDSQKKKKSKKSEDKDYKVEKKKLKNDPDDEEAAEEDSTDSKKKKRKKKKHRKLFDEFNPWRSSSDSSTSAEEEEEEEEVGEESDDEELQYVSDHEFSPESDMEGDGEALPLKRARTARKESDVEEVDDCPCQKCGKSDHPEWILLCDRCDNGWHCSCLRPPLLVIPEGDWFCPPCQHVTLLKKLQDKLKEYDKKLSKKEIEDRRKQRLAYVGISLNSVLPTKEVEVVKKRRLSSKDDDDEVEEETTSEESESASASASESGSDSDEPIYQLRQRRQAHSYRFNDYDELINSAIQDEMEAVKGAGNQGRGKDIATIVNAEKEEERKKEGENTVEESTEIPEPLPPVVPLNDKDKEPKPIYSDDEPIQGVRKKIIGRKKHRKLNSLDISSADDEDSDEDFKGTSSESDDDFEEELGSEDSEDLDSGRSRRRNTDPVRRSTRARTSRYDADFIDDGDSEDEEEAPRRKKKRSIWDDSESEESDRSWGRRKRKPANKTKKTNTTTKKKKSKKKKKDNDDSDVEVYKKKKPKIKFGLEGENEGPGRRTRGKKINYVDALGSDSEEDRVKRPPPRIESEEEYVANEEDEFDEDDKVTDEEEVESIEEINNTKQPKVQIQSYTDARFTQLLPEGVPTPKDLYSKNQLNQEDDIDDEPNPIDQINRNLEEMDENEMEKMMEEEEYANKQLQLVALQIEKEKKRKEREAKRLEGLLPPQLPQQDQSTPKKRGRKPKNQFQFTAPMQEPIVGNVDSLIVNSENNDELSEPPGVSLPLFAELGTSNESLEDPTKKRRNRNKKSLEEAVANLGSVRQQETTVFMTMGNKALPTDLSNQESNIEIAAPPQPFSQSQPTPSVITRMLQSKPGQPGYPVGTIRPKQFAAMADREDEVPTSLAVSSGASVHPSQFMQGGALRSQLSSPYRPIPPNINHYSRGTPPPHQIRNPVPQTIPSHIYHSHRPMDPSPSGGGPINIADHNSPARVVSPASSSPGSNKNETPPPPYSRPPVGRFPIITSSGPRHMQMVAPHLQAPRPNLSPYHPSLPPSYHFGPFTPSMGGAEDALPPTVYENSPYSEQFPNEGHVNQSENSNSKSFDEESGGEFGGLVSYFSSQREDDLES